MSSNNQLQGQIDGVLNISKPSGATSMDVVRSIKKWTKQKRVGHGGTLDPLATGVLPICFGKATRLMEYLVDSPKTYHTRLKLGITTDTYDIDGEVTSTKDPSYVTQQMLEDVLGSFMGNLEQVPPMYSALKHEGTRLYKLARDGIEIERPSRSVRIDSIIMTTWDPPFFEIKVQCGKGMYVRSLSHDIGELLKCGATVVALTRLQSGPFHLNESVSLETIQQTITTNASWISYIKPADLLVQHLQHTVVTEGRESLIKNGRPFSLENIELVDLERPWRIYGLAGNFLAIATYDKSTGLWHPSKVLDIGKEISASSEIQHNE
jgi:tRNA pseudouridine55 synthase